MGTPFNELVHRVSKDLGLTLETAAHVVRKAQNKVALGSSLDFAGGE